MGSLLLLALGGCSDDDNSFNQNRDEAQLKASRTQIENFVADTSCSETSQCRAIELGSKPCGGAWEYLIYSDATVDPADVEAMVSDHNQLESRLNLKHGFVSDCSLPEIPTLECREERCSGAQDFPGILFDLEEEFTLQAGQVARLRGYNIAFQFEQVVSESRCPSDAYCIWPGEAVLEIQWIQPPSSENTTIRYGYGSQLNGSIQSDLFLRVVDVLPYPISSPFRDPKLSTVTFRFESLATE